MNEKKRRLFAVGIIAFFLLLAGALYLLTSSGEAGAYVLVCVDGREEARYLLSEDGEYALNGGTNTLIIEDGYAYLLDAKCPDKLCVKQGRIHYDGQCITCLPNKLTVTVMGGEDNGIDMAV